MTEPADLTEPADFTDLTEPVGVVGVRFPLGDFLGVERPDVLGVDRLEPVVDAGERGGVPA